EKHPAFRQGEIKDLEVDRVDTHELGRAADAALDNECFQQDLGTDLADDGNVRADAVHIAQRETWRKLAFLFQPGFFNLFLALFYDGLDDDVVHAHESYLLKDFLLSAIAYGKHGNHGSHPEDDAEGRQEGPHLVGEDGVDGDVKVCQQPFLHGVESDRATPARAPLWRRILPLRSSGAGSTPPLSRSGAWISGSSPAGFLLLPFISGSRTIGSSSMSD